MGEDGMRKHGAFKRVSKATARWVFVAVLCLALTVTDAGVSEAQVPESTTADVGVEARANFDHLIGRVFPGGRSPVLRWQYRGGAVLRSSARLGMSVYRTPTRRYVFVTKRRLRYRPDGVPIWRILDTATTRDPVPRNGYWGAVGDCRKQGRPLPRTLGVASGPRPYYNWADELWVWSTPDGRMRPRRIGGVTCWTGNVH